MILKISSISSEFKMNIPFKNLTDETIDFDENFNFDSHMEKYLKLVLRIFGFRLEFL